VLKVYCKEKVNAEVNGDDNDEVDQNAKAQRLVFGQQHEGINPAILEEYLDHHLILVQFRLY
jgi:hypothetical protein